MINHVTQLTGSATSGRNRYLALAALAALVVLALFVGFDQTDC
jgi:hypothetical protein